MPKTELKIKLPLTPPVDEGPYYTPGSPERQNIVGKGTVGTKLVVEGMVLNREGKPLSHAWLDFWHADGNSQYDNRGYNLRGHQYTDKGGKYHLETVKPLGYMMRAPHVHAKVRAKENSPLLTVQLFFPGEKKNATDSLFEKRTVMEVKDTAEGKTAAFDFVVEE